MAGGAGRSGPSIEKRIFVIRECRLDMEEAAALRSQIATSNAGQGGRHYAPYVFTEQGVAMLSGVLRSKRAAAVNIEIMRAFVELRRVAASYGARQGWNVQLVGCAAAGKTNAISSGSLGNDSWPKRACCRAKSFLHRVRSTEPG